MSTNRGLWGYTEAPGLAPHKALGLSMSNCSTGPFLPCSGGSRDEQGRSEFGPKSVSSPAYPGQVAPVWEVLQKKKKKKTLVLIPRGNSVRSSRHIPQGPKRNVGEGERVSGPSPGPNSKIARSNPHLPRP